jgi:hypothetical protein
LFKRCGIALLDVAVENEVAEDRIGRPILLGLLVVRLVGFHMKTRRGDTGSLDDGQQGRRIDQKN